MIVLIVLNCSKILSGTILELAETIATVVLNFSETIFSIVLDLRKMVALDCSKRSIVPESRETITAVERFGRKLALTK